MPAAKPLLDADFLTRLQRLEIVSKKVFVGKTKGERLSKRKGQSVEFADFRQYVVGDDLRFLDWNLFARLDRLFLRLFLEEEDLHVYLLIDNSLSMEFGNPSKLHYAKVHRADEIGPGGYRGVHRPAYPIDPAPARAAQPVAADQLPGGRRAGRPERPDAGPQGVQPEGERERRGDRPE